MDSFWGCSRSEERLPRQHSNGKFTAAVVGVGLLSKAAVVLRAVKDTRDPQETKESPESQ